MSPYTLAWLIWGFAFVLLEGAALLDVHRPGGTLSETIWRWARVRGKNGGGWTWRRWFLLVFLAWLLGHLVWGWWPS